MEADHEILPFVIGHRAVIPRKTAVRSVGTLMQAGSPEASLWLAGDGLLRSCVLVNRPDYRLVKWEPSEYAEALEKLS
jgi:hypothetical protein